MSDSEYPEIPRGWISRGARAGRVREIGAGETAWDAVEPDGAAVRRIREWLEEE